MRAILAALLLAMPLHVAAQDDVERLRIHGSNTMGVNLMPTLVESWLGSIGYTHIKRVPRGSARMEIHAQRDAVPLIVEIDKRGSASGINDLIDGNTEIAMLSRRPDADELDADELDADELDADELDADELDAAWQLGGLGSPDQEYVIVLDGVAIVVHARNPLRKLSLAQLRSTFSGQIRNWAEIGGPAAPINVQMPAPASGAREFSSNRCWAARPVARCQSRGRRRDCDWYCQPVYAHSFGHTAVGHKQYGGIAIAPTRLNSMSEDYPLVRRGIVVGRSNGLGTQRPLAAPRKRVRVSATSAWKSGCCRTTCRRTICCRRRPAAPVTCPGVRSARASQLACPDRSTRR